MKHSLRKAVTLVLVIIFITITFSLVGCTVIYPYNVVFISTAPTDQTFHPQTRTVFFEDTDNGTYFLCFADPSVAGTDTDIFSQIEELKPNGKYQIITDSSTETTTNTIHLFSISPAPDK